MRDGAFRRSLALLVLAMMVLAAGCSSIRFSYNQGDTLLYWWMDSYVDFEGQQADVAKRDIGAVFQWHRKTELRDYAALLGTFQRQLAGNPTQADLLGAYREIRVRADRLAQRAVPELTTLAMSVTPEQIGNIERKFKDKNDEYRRKFIEGSADKRQRARFKKSMEQMELWFGKFSSEQEATLRRASDLRPLDNHLWLEERQYRQRRVLAVLNEIHQKKLNREQTSARVASLLKEMSSRMDSPERKGFYDASLDQTTKFILTAIRLTTPKQKAHAQQRMQGWIGDFEALAAAK